MAQIKIFNGDTNSQELEMSDGGHTFEGKGKSIKWEIADPEKSNVASIKIVPQSGAEIFSELPTEKDGKWSAKIDDDAREKAECKYSIFWLVKEGKETLEHDPKISVKP